MPEPGARSIIGDPDKRRLLLLHGELHQYIATDPLIEDSIQRLPAIDRLRPGISKHHLPQLLPHGLRSEEHTSELQSLMRNSYAVFRLKKKNKTTNAHSKNRHIHQTEYS